jgi:hypothetical protein
MNRPGVSLVAADRCGAGVRLGRLVQDGRSWRVDPDFVRAEVRVAARFEFMCREWIASAREEITRALAGKDLGPTRFVLCEAFTNPPQHLRRDDSDTIGFCLVVGGGALDVSDRPSPDADCTIVSDYADALAIARDPDAAANEEAAMAERVADGRLKIVGDPSAAPAVLRQLNIHALLAARTA